MRLNRDKRPDTGRAAIVKALGGHHDQIVSQYSVWAIAENPNLSLADLGIDLKNVDRQPSNVRSWAYQLVAMDKNAAAHIELIRQGAEDEDAEARRGITLGLKETYFDGLDAFVTEWLFSEGDDEVRNSLVDHIVCQSSKSASYEETALELYSKEAVGSRARQRMEAAAAGTALYGKLQRISAQQSLGLFAIAAREDGTKIVNNTFNIGSITGNAAFNGDAVNSGSMPISQNGNTVTQLLAALDKAASIINAADLPQDVKDEVTKAVVDTKAKPTKGGFKTALEWIGKAQGLLMKTAESSEALEQLGEVGTSIASMIGSMSS